MAVAVENTLAFLLGRWSIERVIDDHFAGQRLSFSGIAEVELDADADADADARGSDPAVARYTERGEIRQGSHVGPARRTLRFSERPGGSVRVDFQDGRPFLDLDLAPGKCSALHPCRADSYAMEFEVLGPDRIRETWRVIGPAKDYAAETIWRRVTPRRDPG